MSNPVQVVKRASLTGLFKLHGAMYRSMDHFPNDSEVVICSRSSASSRDLTSWSLDFRAKCSQ